MWLLVSIDWLLLSQDSEGEHFKKFEISFLQCFGAKDGTPPPTLTVSGPPRWAGSAVPRISWLTLRKL
ncbi:MAG: hypothetical protein DME83_04510 [Verrucomicrobia bacterium]|nr:MAG: hypothetical protein DME83_04510 [Verrucomicrobiota bacterium]